MYAAYSLYIAIRTCHLFIKSIIFEKMSVVLFLREGGGVYKLRTLLYSTNDSTIMKMCFVMNISFIFSPYQCLHSVIDGVIY